MSASRPTTPPSNCAARAYDVVLLIAAVLVLGVVIVFTALALPAAVRRLEYEDFVGALRSAPAASVEASARFDAAIQLAALETSAAAILAAAARDMLAPAKRSIEARSLVLRCDVSRLHVAPCATLPVLFAEVYGLRPAHRGRALVANRTHVCGGAVPAGTSADVELFHSVLDARARLLPARHKA